MTTICFDINGLTSHGEADRLADSLSTLDGVTSARVSVQRGRVLLTSEAHSVSARLAARAHEAVTRAGYEVASRFAPSRRRWAGTTR